jgi:hypothetical protein
MRRSDNRLQVPLEEAAFELDLRQVIAVSYCAGTSGTGVHLSIGLRDQLVLWATDPQTFDRLLSAAMEAFQTD